MGIRKALEELLLIVEIHQKHTKNNFAWAEVEYAKELLAQPEKTEQEQEPVAKITSIHTDGENLPVVITAIVLSEAVNIWDLPIKNNDLLYLAPPNREPVALAGTVSSVKPLKRGMKGIKNTDANVFHIKD